MTDSTASLLQVAHYTNFRVYLNDKQVPLVQHLDFYLKNNIEYLELDLIPCRDVPVQSLFDPPTDQIRIIQILENGQENIILNYHIQYIKISKFKVGVNSDTVPVLGFLFEGTSSQSSNYSD